MPTPPPNNQQGPRLHVAKPPNPEQEQRRKDRWRTVETAAITVLVSLTVAGAATWAWKAATKRANRIFRRQQLEDQQQQLSAAAYGYGPPPPPTPPGWPPQPVQNRPQNNPREITMPEALSQIPSLQPVQAQPVIMPDLSRLVEKIEREPPYFKAFRGRLDTRISGIEQRLEHVESNPDDDDDEYEDDLDEEIEAEMEAQRNPPPKAPKRGRR